LGIIQLTNIHRYHLNHSLKSSGDSSRIQPKRTMQIPLSREQQFAMAPNIDVGTPLNHRPTTRSKRAAETPCETPRAIIAKRCRTGSALSHSRVTRSTSRRRRQTFPFLALPGELRVMMYESALNFDQFRRLGDGDPPAAYDKFPHSLLLANKQIRHEMLATLKGKPLVFNGLPADESSLRLAMSPKILSSVQVVEINYHHDSILDRYLGMDTVFGHVALTRLNYFLDQLVDIWHLREHSLESLTIRVTARDHQHHISTCYRGVACPYYSALRRVLMTLLRLRGIRKVYIHGSFDLIADYASVVKKMSEPRPFPLHRLPKSILSSVMHYAIKNEGLMMENPLGRWVDFERQFWDSSFDAMNSGLDALLHRSTSLVFGGFAVLPGLPGHYVAKINEALGWMWFQPSNLVNVARFMTASIPRYDEYLFIDQPFIPMELLFAGYESVAEDVTMAPYVKDFILRRATHLRVRITLDGKAQNKAWLPLMSAVVRVFWKVTSLEHVILELVESTANFGTLGKTKEQETQMALKAFSLLMNLRKVKHLTTIGPFDDETLQKVEQMKLKTNVKRLRAKLY
jgi:hypothetical protein